MVGGSDELLQTRFRGRRKSFWSEIVSQSRRADLPWPVKKFQPFDDRTVCSWHLSIPMADGRGTGAVLRSDVDRGNGNSNSKSLLLLHSHSMPDHRHAKP